MNWKYELIKAHFVTNEDPVREMRTFKSDHVILTTKNKGRYTVDLKTGEYHEFSGDFEAIKRSCGFIDGVADPTFLSELKDV